MMSIRDVYLCGNLNKDPKSKAKRQNEVKFILKNVMC